MIPLLQGILKSVPWEVQYHIQKEDHRHFLQYPTVNHQESGHECTKIVTQNNIKNWS